MNEKQKRIIKAKYKDKCWLLLSGIDSRDGQSDYIGYVDYVASFLYDAGDVAVEWEPKHGPIQVWHKCEKDAEGAKEHYFYDYENSPPGSWSQLAVEGNNMHFHFFAGNYDYIFTVLKEWATD